MGGVQTDYIGNKYVDGNGCLTAAGCLNYSDVHVFLANGNGCDPNDEVGDCPNGDNETGPSMYLLNNTGRTGSTRGSAMVTPTQVPNDSGQVSMTQQGAECGEGCDSNSSGAWPSSWFRSSLLPTEQFPIVADDVNNLDQILLPTIGNSQHLACDGQWVSNRDSEDARILGVYQNQLADDLFLGQHSAPSIAAGTACADSDQDGMPDVWEIANGLNPLQLRLLSGPSEFGVSDFRSSVLGGRGREGSASTTHIRVHAPLPVPVPISGVPLTVSPSYVQALVFE